MNIEQKLKAERLDRLRSRLKSKPRPKGIEAELFINNYLIGIMPAFEISKLYGPYRDYTVRLINNKNPHDDIRIRFKTIIGGK